ncbi:MAG TPA: DUF4396 domain-containing protein [Desulfuromonadales bacterium]|nr:DUF4396 domain-containing protein [Candidatus Krumholzibacteria bacterium]HKK00595.1 DUF4396 domain-containing protein [Desulfuromonadales bacterium]
MLTILAIASLVIAGLCSCIIVLDILRGRRQQVGVMNLVWPISALYAGPLGLWAYFKLGRLSTKGAMQSAKSRGEEPPAQSKPLWQSVGLAATHCGSGCTLGDLLAEGVVLSLVPFTLFGHEIFAAWVVDYILAFLIGIAFQYFTIAPMKQLSVSEALTAALKADTLSLTGWQVGMYGWMAIAVFLIFGRPLEKSDPVFWFMMQIAMLAGFLTSYPVNWWLVRAGIKEKM